LIVRRGQNIPNNGSLATIDFGVAEAVAPAGGDITLAGSAGGASIVQSMNYLTATGPNSCSASPLWNSVAGGSTTFTVYGVPSNLQVNGDFHSLTVLEDLGTPNIRSVSESFKTMGNRTLTLGAALSAPTLTTLAGPYKRLQSDFALPAEYGRAVSFSYFDQNNEKTVLLYASSGWVGGTSGTLSTPDFSSVSGWNNAWAPASAASTNYGLGAFGGSAQDACTEGARSIFAVRTGATP